MNCSWQVSRVNDVLQEFDQLQDDLRRSSSTLSTTDDMSIQSITPIDAEGEAEAAGEGAGKGAPGSATAAQIAAAEAEAAAFNAA